MEQTHAITLNDLPPPPPGRTGWPWDVAGAPTPAAMPDGSPWPRISVVTPSYNQGRYLEETIRSVLLQGYPNLEYFVMDGGSRDESGEIIRKYAPWITGWVSERDRGQSDAIAKGFDRATGELIAWLNSDDLYVPDALTGIAMARQQHPDAILAGHVINFLDGAGKETLIVQSGIALEHMVKYWEGRYRWHQPGLFFPRSAYQQAGGMDITLQYAMDHDLVCRLLACGTPLAYVDRVLARFRLHAVSKTCSQQQGMILETSRVSQRYWSLVGEVKQADHDAYVFGELFRHAAANLLAGRPTQARELMRLAYAPERGVTPWSAPSALWRYAGWRIGRFRRFATQ